MVIVIALNLEVAGNKNANGNYLGAMEMKWRFSLQWLRRKSSFGHFDKNVCRTVEPN